MAETIPIVFHAFQTDQGDAKPVKSSLGTNTSVNNFRRSHKKSRGGCTRCKTRRIKCDEAKPCCLRCQRRGHSCIYPSNSVPEQDRSEPSTSPNPERLPIAYPTVVSETFTIDDMRLFYHFLLASKPHIPVGNDEVWTHEVPQYAFHNKYLMQSMLGSAASHLGKLTHDDSLQLQALTYRGQGIEGLRKALLTEEWKEGHADSLIAATTSLLVQSAHLEDGFQDWLTLIKLQQSISAKVRESNYTIPLAFDITPQHHLEAIEPYLPLLPCIHPELISSGLTSLRKFQPLLTDDDDIAFCESVKGALLAHQHSPQTGYLAFGLVFKFFYDLETLNYYKLINPNNAYAQILLSHFLCVLLLVLPLGVIENHLSIKWASRHHVRGVLGWLHGTFDNIPKYLHEHLDFPRAICATVVAEIEHRSFMGPSVLQFEIANELAKQIGEMKLEKSK